MSKQYVVIVDDEGTELLSHLVRPGVLQFVEVQGLNMNDEGKYNILVSPIPQEIENV